MFTLFDIIRNCHFLTSIFFFSPIYEILSPLLFLLLHFLREKMIVGQLRYIASRYCLEIGKSDTHILHMYVYTAARNSIGVISPTKHFVTRESQLTYITYIRSKPWLSRVKRNSSSLPQITIFDRSVSFIESGIHRRALVLFLNDKRLTVTHQPLVS